MGSSRSQREDQDRLTVSLARTVARLMDERRRGGLPQEVRRQARLHIADSIGIARAALGSGGLAEQVFSGLAAGSAGGDCAVFGSAQRYAPAFAAFANSALVHILDFDDIHDAARLHPTAVCLPAALAAAQLADTPAAKVVDAVALGNELMCRLGVMCLPTGAGPGSDWFLTQLFGYFGAALAAAVVLELNEDAVVSALGLAYMQAAGGKEAGFGTGANARAIYPAFAAMGGVQACLLARAGITGPEGALDGAAGLFRLYLGGPPSTRQRALLLDPLTWHFTATQLKPWPSCRLSHPYVAAALSVREQCGGARIARVEAAVNASAARLCHPPERRRRPATLQDAKYSIPWMIAFTLIHGRADLQVLNEAALHDAAVLDMAQRVAVVESLPDRPGHPPARIRLEAVDGRAWESLPELAIDGMTEDTAFGKFSACLAHAGAQPSESEALWSRLMAMDEAPDADFMLAQPS